jgi:hypothetical protein
MKAKGCGFYRLGGIAVLVAVLVVFGLVGLAGAQGADEAKKELTRLNIPYS